MSTPLITFSRRMRQTPFTSRVLEGGVRSMEVYNHMMLPSWFRGLEKDYWHLCRHVQVWDVSCERQIQLRGPDAARLVQLMTPRDLSGAQDDQCFYVPLVDERGKMINDPIAIHVDEHTWWLSIADSDVMLWAKGLAVGMGLDVDICEAAVWPVAVQGPKADELMARVFGDVIRDIRFFRYRRLTWQDHAFIVARSGWSHQGGFEIYVDDAELGQKLWDTLFETGEDLHVGHGTPNDIERIEAGLLSFGCDMDYRHSPLQCGLDKFCHLDRDLPSLSVKALAAQKAAGIPSRLVGVVVPSLPRDAEEFAILADGVSTGEVTSHCFSERFDAWLSFVILDTPVIDRVKDGNVKLESATNRGKFDAVLSEIPFAFEQMALPAHSLKG